MPKNRAIYPALIVIVLLSIFLSVRCSKEPQTPDDNKMQGITEELDPFVQNKLLGRGVNLGNALEAPNEGEWGVILQESYFKLIKEAGFNSVRIPIRWSAHAAPEYPFLINSTFFSRIDWAIGQALKNGLAVIINMHHYQEIMEQPEQHKARFLALWDQIAPHYRNLPKELFFEILNEPHDSLTPALWNAFLNEAIGVIRKTNPGRTLIVGTANWGGLHSLNDLVIPDDHNIIVTYHYYNPFQFTHQGAEWVNGSETWLGTQWTGTQEEKQAVSKEFDQAVAWAGTNNRPLFMGEFGAYSKAAMGSRARWTAFVAREAEARGISWAYWEFCAGFGVYDTTKNDWNWPLLTALIPG